MLLGTTDVAVGQQALEAVARSFLVAFATRQAMKLESVIAPGQPRSHNDGVTDMHPTDHDAVDHGWGIHGDHVIPARDSGRVAVSGALDTMTISALA